MAAFRRGTKVYAKIESLSAQTDIADLTALAAVNQCDMERLSHLQTRSDALRSEAGQLRLQVAKADLDLFRRVLAVGSGLNGIEWGKYSPLRGSVHAARKRHEDATVNAFRGSAIPGMLSDAWRAFIEAGETYIQSTQPNGYPAEGQPCVYCRQPLLPAAVDLVHRYRDFCNDQPKKEVTEAQAALDDFTRPFLEMGVSALQADVIRRVESMDPGAVPPVLQQSLALTESAIKVQHRYADGDEVGETDAKQLQQIALDVIGLARTAVQQADELVTELAAAVGEREKTLADLTNEISELEARVKLAEVIEGVKQQVGNAKWVVDAERVSGRFTGLLRSLTEVAKTASQELLNRDFERLFENERKALRAPEIRLEFPGREGEQKRRKRLAKHVLSEVLSEGEQKVIALADFLAEAAMPQTVAPVVFDDPVTSLDYKRLQHVVDRIVELSSTRQVVVFTHNIWFTAELLNRFEKSPGACSYYEISNEDAPGKVEQLQHPKWDTPTKIAKEVEERIRNAEKLTGAVREDVVRAG